MSRGVSIDMTHVFFNTCFQLSGNLFNIRCITIIAWNLKPAAYDACFPAGLFAF